MMPRIRARLTKMLVLFCAAVGEYGSRASKPTLTVRLRLWVRFIHNVTSRPSHPHQVHFPELHLFAVNVGEQVSTWFLPFSVFLLSICPCLLLYFFPTLIYQISFASFTPISSFLFFVLLAPYCIPLSFVFYVPCIHVYIQYSLMNKYTGGRSSIPDEGTDISPHHQPQAPTTIYT